MPSGNTPGASPYAAGVDAVTAYLGAWRESVDRVLTLFLRLDREDWARETDLPGWTVQDVLAHLAHVESALAGGDVASALSEPGRSTLPPDWTEPGVAARRDRAPDALRAELAAAVLHRTSELERAQPLDPTGRPENTPAGLDWDWATLLRNRAIDVWVHEQDVRRATDRPGGMSGDAAELVLGSFADALPYVLGKKVGADPGTVVRWRVRGPVELERTVRVDDLGRAAVVDDADPTVTLDLDSETFLVLVAGRRGWEQVHDRVHVDGDGDLARRVVDAMGVTP